MYRPNEIEEKRILELTKWIGKAKENSEYSNYVIEHISNEIKFAWEHYRYRKNLCSNDLEKTKQYLLNKFSEEGRLSELVKQNIQEIKEAISKDVYDYFINFSEKKVGLYLAHMKYHTALMVESGWLPNLKGILDCNLDEEAQVIQLTALKINEQYLELLDWFGTLVPNEIIDEKGIKAIKSEFYKSHHISKLFHARKKENSLEYVKKTIIEENSKARRSNFIVLNDKVLEGLKFERRPEKKTKEERQEIRTASETKLYPNQEAFYAELESWAKSLNNPYCREFIVRYLRKGRQLPFYQIRVFKFIKDIEKAKDFLLEQYELKLGKSIQKEQEQERRSDKIWEKRSKSDLRFYRKALKESGSVDFTEDDLKGSKGSSNKVTDYSLGYAGTWAHDEAGWSNDDIDTVLDGDPDAYWNID